MNHPTRFALPCLIVLSFFKVSAHSTSLHKYIKPAFDSVKAVKEIAGASKTFADALSKSDSAGVANCYGEGAEILNDGRPSTIGKAAITHFYGNMIDYGIIKFNYTTTGPLGSGKVVVKGGYLLVWKREKGRLKIFRDTFFSDSK